jgi:hypothetical protein
MKEDLWRRCPAYCGCILKYGQKLGIFDYGSRMNTNRLSSPLLLKLYSHQEEKDVLLCICPDARESSSLINILSNECTCAGIWALANHFG